MRVFIAAHSHIDAAWLWTLEETIKVCSESFSKVLDLLERHPGVVYVQSSALYYRWMEKYHPQLFKRIVEAVKSGRWKVTLPFVETDAYMPSGETIIREIVYAQRYFREKFSVDPKTLWLPDSFGFSNTLPSLAAGCGVKYFYTQKLNWNDVILFPYRLFRWRGPDGKSLLAYISPGGYSGSLSRERVEEELAEMRSNGFDTVYTLYGYGDHGGGLDEEMAAQADKMVEEGYARPAGPDEFFRAVEEAGYKLPVWEGELYLQYHRGVWTTQAGFKRRFRQAENLLLDAEALYSMASMMGLASDAGAAALENTWADLLVLAFHDIISGSSIREVYEEAEKILARIRDRAVSTIASSVKSLLRLGDTKRGRVYVLNTLPWRREAVLALEEGVIHAGPIPPLGYTPARHSEGYSVSVSQEGRSVTVSNRFFEARFDSRTGALYSLRRGGWEALGAPVLLHVYVDEPLPGRRTIKGGLDATLFDAWELFHTHRPGGAEYVVLDKPEEFRVKRLGGSLVEVVARYRYRQEGRRDSLFTITWRVDGASPWVELRVQVDWHAAHRLVKLIVPFASSPSTIYFDQPYGWTERRPPCSAAASLFDRAMWEVPARNWVYAPYTETRGLAVFSDTVYGYSYGCGHVGLSLIRAPKYPEPISGGDEGYTDQGRHEARMGVAALDGVSGLSTVERLAMEFTRPPLVWRADEEGSGLYGEEHGFASSSGAVLAAVVPLGGNTYLLRLYNPEPGSVDAEVKLPARVVSAWRALHGGEELERVEHGENLVRVKLGPREVATVKVVVEKTL